MLTQNSNPIHFDHEYTVKTESGKALFNSTLTLALVTGPSVIDLSLNAMANLGWDEVRLPNPVFEGETIYSQSEVVSTRESKSRPNVGIVAVKTTGFNQDGTGVIEFTRTFMVNKRDHVPAITHMPDPTVCGGVAPPRSGVASMIPDPLRRWRSHDLGCSPASRGVWGRDPAILTLSSQA